MEDKVTKPDTKLGSSLKNVRKKVVDFTKSTEPELFAKEKEINEQIDKLLVRFDEYETKDDKNEILDFTDIVPNIKMEDDGFYKFVYLNMADKKLLSGIGEIDINLIEMMVKMFDMSHLSFESTLTDCYEIDYMTKRLPEVFPGKENLDALSDEEVEKLKEGFSVDVRKIFVEAKGKPVTTGIKEADELISVYASLRNYIYSMKVLALLLLKKMSLQKSSLGMKYDSICNSIMTERINKSGITTDGDVATFDEFIHMTLGKVTPGVFTDRDEIEKTLRINMQSHQFISDALKSKDDINSENDKEFLIGKKNFEEILHRISRNVIRIATKGIDHSKDFYKPGASEIELSTLLHNIALRVKGVVDIMDDEIFNVTPFGYEENELIGTEAINPIISFVMWIGKSTIYPVAMGYKEKLMKKIKSLTKKAKETGITKEMDTQFIRNRFAYNLLTTHMIDILGVSILGEGFSKIKFGDTDTLRELMTYTNTKSNKAIYTFFATFLVADELYRTISSEETQTIIYDQMREYDEKFSPNERFDEIFQAFFVTWLNAKIRPAIAKKEKVEK